MKLVSKVEDQNQHIQILSSPNHCIMMLLKIDQGWYNDNIISNHRNN